MESTTKRITSIYTEATPNPETMKFVLNKMLMPQSSADFPTFESAKEYSPLAVALYQNFDFINCIFIMNNFVTVTKKTNVDWFEVVADVREFIRSYVNEELPIINETFIEFKRKEQQIEDTDENESDIVKRIKDLIKTYVQPAVEMDGGTIVFKSFEDGVVKLGMQGSCSGCPSSSITLKSGIEGLMKRMIPEVQAVEADAL